MTAPKLDEADIFNVARQIGSLDVQRLYIEQVCGDDQALRVRLEALLRVHREDQAFLDRPAEGVPTTPDRRAIETAGRQIGPYKLLEEIGEGGFGKVFMAAQTQPVRRMVALKIIKPGMDTRQVIARFESERQALALMNHPNIAQIIGGGETDSGRPYFVMELVRGVPITEFCDANHLPAQERLKLFVSVCHAIQHAHQKGVIHRDIKPSNVMITLNDGTPVVKIIDFGVAKAISQRLTEKTLFTSYGQMVGTPAYMSPEQASTSLLDVDTRSDIYSLGVLLYELLTGTTPIEAARLREAGFAEIQRLIRDEESPRPSARLSSLGASVTSVAGNRATDSKHLFRLLAGDLDWIVMKALEKDRNRRYETPGSFADDIDRYLRHEAILARPPSLGYRLTKLASRHRAAVVTSALVLAALVAGTAVATWQAIVATRAKHEAMAATKAESQAKQLALDAASAESKAKQIALSKEAETQAVLGFVQDHILAAARPKGRDGGLGSDVSLRAAIEAAVPYVGSGFKDQPLTEARLRCTMGNSFIYLGDAAAAAAQFEPARAIYTRLLGPDHADTLRCVTQLGISYWMQGRAAQCIQLQEQVLPLAKAKFGPDARPTLDCMNSLALGLHEIGKDEEALQIHEHALAIKKKKYGRDDRTTLVTMINLATVYHSLYRYDDALNLRSETVEIYNGKNSLDDSSALTAMHNLADSFRAVGRHEEALRVDQDTRSRREKLLGADHPDTISSVWSVAHDLIRLQRGDKAIPLLDECLKRAVGRHLHRDFWVAARLRLRHFEKARNVEECRRTAELWEMQERIDERSLYLAAVCRGVTARLIKEGNSSGREAIDRMSDESDRAMAWLTKAVAAGFHNLIELNASRDFDTLRDRADFKKLVADVTRKEPNDAPL
jgi:serine/threonine protein kinase/tetratricopeptide (TPR) repeat protein